MGSVQEMCNHKVTTYQSMDQWWWKDLDVAKRCNRHQEALSHV